MRFKPLPAAERLWESFTYAPLTGQLYRDGAPVGGVTAKGYITLRLDGVPYYAHRLVWKWCSGHDPAAEVDHINGTRTDNRISNLRPADRAQQTANSARRHNNRSGYKGVNFYPRLNRWVAQIQKHKKKHHLGYFTTAEEAAAAYAAASLELHGEFGRST